MTEFPGDDGQSCNAASDAIADSVTDCTPNESEDQQHQQAASGADSGFTLRKGMTHAALALLFVLGLAHWAWFLNFGDIPWELIDWPKERAYCDVLQQAFQQGKIPLHISAAYHGTDRFLGNPEINLSPQVVLLAFVDPGSYMVLNVLVLYTAGFIGCLLIRRRFQLGLISFLVLWLLFNFNGHITSHLAASHPMWAGYFLLPFFLLWLLEWSEEGSSPALIGKLSLAIVAILLQGSFHLTVWCWMFVALFGLFNPRRWKETLAVLGLSGLLSSFRLIPGVVAFWGVKGHPVLPGYRDIWEMVEALAVLRDGKEPAKEIAAGSIFWWEYDLYIGLIGLALLLCFGIAARWRISDPADTMPELSTSPTAFSSWDGPMLVLAFLALNPYWSVIAALPLPLVSSERVPSRFFLLPVLMIMLIAVVRLNNGLRRVSWTPFLVALIVCGLAELTRGLVEHSLAWHMSGYSETVRGMMFQRPRVVEIVHRPDPLYVASIFVGLGVSAATALAWWWLRSESEPSECGPPVDMGSGRN